jgi:hypothetical protein
MRQEVEFILPPIVLLALFLVIISEYCTPTPVSQLITSINPSHSFDPFCYVKSFEPEDPEFGKTPTPLQNSSFYPLHLSKSSIPTVEVVAVPEAVT